jgi:hypothetical protein
MTLADHRLPSPRLNATSRGTGRRAARSVRAQRSPGTSPAREEALANSAHDYESALTSTVLKASSLPFFE